MVEELEHDLGVWERGEQWKYQKEEEAKEESRWCKRKKQVGMEEVCVFAASDERMIANLDLKRKLANLWAQLDAYYD